MFDPVGVGEEALFRGYVQTELAEQLGIYGGLATSSAIFGAIHTFNFVDPGHDLGDALYAVPVISAIGALFGAAYICTATGSRPASRCTSGTTSCSRACRSRSTRRTSRS